MIKNTFSVTVRMPQELFNRLKERAGQDHRSLSGEAAFMIAYYMNNIREFPAYYTTSYQSVAIHDPEGDKNDQE